MAFKKIETALDGLYIIEPDVFGDSRGFFLELYNQRSFEQIGLGKLYFVQDNVSSSTRGTVRGMHFQAPPYAQGKLVTVLQGAVLDIGLDIRRSSPTYGQHVAVELSAENHRMLYIPPGFAHGFQVLSDTCLFCYKVTDLYTPASEGGIHWNDPALALPWRDIEPVVSARDMQAPLFSEFVSPFE